MNVTSPAVRDDRRPAALITGASSGIGHACVAALAGAGYQVYAGVRRTAAAEALQREFGPAVHPLVFDLLRQDTVESAVDRMGQAVDGLDALINNAGIALAGPLEVLPADALRESFEAGLLGHHTLTRLMLPMLRARGGRLVWVSSVSGRVALPYRGPYAACKFAMEALADAWRLELREQGLRVILIEPGRIRTPIWGKSLDLAKVWFEQADPAVSQRYAETMSAMEAAVKRRLNEGASAAEVADAVLHSLTSKRPRARYVLGRDAKLLLWINRLPTGWRDRVLARLLQRS